MGKCTDFALPDALAETNYPKLSDDCPALSRRAKMLVARRRNSTIGGFMLLPKTALAAVVLASFNSFAHADSTAATLEMTASGEVQIAPDGHVSAYLLKSQLPSTVANIVDRDVRAWHFEPVIVDGQAVVAKTAIVLRLKAEPIAENKDSYKLHVVDVQFGEPMRNARIKTPQYPAEAVRDHVGAKVMLCVRLDENGNVVEAHPYQTSLDVETRRDSEAEHFRRLFEKASVSAAHDWHYDLSETINGRAIGTTAMVPVVFSLRGAGTTAPQDGQWKAYLPGPVHPAPWVHNDHLADSHDLSSLQDGHSLSLESRFRLKDQVIGTTL
jgi:hypothetical protein